MKHSNKKVLTLVTAALFAALIFLGTYVFHVPTGFNQGYIHLGDTFIYLAACLLPTPYAAAAGAIGAAFSDLLAAPIYVLPTLIIKAVLTLFFTSSRETILTRRNVIAVFLAGITGLLGYYIAESIMVHNWIAPLIPMPINSLQPIAGGILFIFIGSLLDRARIKQRFPVFAPVKKQDKE